MSARERDPIHHRVLGSLLVASLGCAAGYAYATYTLPPEILAGTGLVGMYATAGAAFSVLGARLAGIAWRLFNDYRDRD